MEKKNHENKLDWFPPRPGLSTDLTRSLAHSWNRYGSLAPTRYFSWHNLVFAYDLDLTALAVLK